MQWFVEVFIPEDIRKFVLVCQNSLEDHSLIMQTPQLKRNKKPSQTRWRIADIALRKKKNWCWGAFLGLVKLWGRSLQFCEGFLLVHAFFCIFMTSYRKYLYLLAGFFWFPFQRIGWCICQMCANCSRSTATLRQHDVKCNRHFMA